VGDFGSNWEAGWPSRKPKLTNNQMRRKYSRSAIGEKVFSFPPCIAVKTSLGERLEASAEERAA